MSLPPELDIRDDEEFNKPRLDRAFGWIAAQIRALQTFQPSWTAAISEVAAHGLARIEEVIRPAYERVMALARFGFLIGSSSTSLALTVGERRTFVIAAGEQRDLFTPTRFVTITRTNAPAEWAIARVEGYAATSGELVVTIEASTISAGAHDDWQVTASAGSVVAAIALLSDTRAARDAADRIRSDTQAIKTAAVNEIGLIRDAVFAAKNTAVKAADDAHAAAILIEGGPVASVNGRTGNVVLATADIPGLPDALANRYSKAEADQKISERIAALVAGSPQLLDTFYEFAAAIGNDPNFAGTVMAGLAGKASKTGDIFTGDITTYRAATPATGVISFGNRGFARLEYNGGNYVLGSGAGGTAGDELFVRGSKVWHAGNFSPAAKADLAGGTFTGNITVAGGNIAAKAPANANAHLWFHNEAGVARGVMFWDRPSDTIRWGRYNASNNAFDVAVWMQGQVFYSNGNVEVQKSDPSLWLHFPGVSHTRIWVGSDGVMRWSDAQGTHHFHFGPDGGLWSRAYGWFHEFVDSKANAAAAQANDRVYRVRMAGYGTTSGTGGMTNVAPAVFTGASGSAYGAQTFGYRTLQQYVPSLGGWVNIYVE